MTIDDIEISTADFVPEQPDVVYVDVTLGERTLTLQLSRPERPGQIGTDADEGVDIRLNTGHDDNAEFADAVYAADLDWPAVANRVIEESGASELLDHVLQSRDGQ